MVQIIITVKVNLKAKYKILNLKERNHINYTMNLKKIIQKFKPSLKESN